MKAAVHSTPTERVCKKGCSPDPQPIGNFYSRGPSAEGFKLYDYTCKVCVGAKEKKRLAAQRRGDYTPEEMTMKPLAERDLVPCADCGLRGHVAQAEVCPQTRRYETRLGCRGEDWLL